MPGYFDDILAAYAPAAPTPVDPPWSDPFPDDPAPADPAPPHSPPAAGVSVAPPAVSAAPDDPADPPHAPAHFFDPPEPPDPLPPLEAPIKTERVIRDHLRETREHVELRRDAAAPDPARALAPIYLQEAIDRSVTHLHDHVQIVQETAFEPAPDAPEPPPASPPEPDAPGSDPRFAALEADLARALARLHGEETPPRPFFAPEDFEPEAPDAQPPPDLHEPREVTREVIRELHHHHHIETRVETPPAAPAPKTAAEASRIGRIRFASDWKTRLR
jgi:hypothetical protein